MPRRPAIAALPPRHRRGAVMIATLLALTLLVGLIFYVYNTGDVINRRMELQSASDAAAIGGATWMARSMNVVAMNNVATSRLLAGIVVLDSLPLATEMAASEANSWEKCLSDQLRIPVPQEKGGQLVWDGLAALQTRMRAERDILKAADEALKQIDMPAATTWFVQGNRNIPAGKMWQACLSLDEMSGMTVESAGPLAYEAAGWGRLEAFKTPVAMMSPVLPEIPCKQTTFDDFRPVLMGSQIVTSTAVDVRATGGWGGAIPDAVWPHRLGPWARLFDWRLNHYDPPAETITVPTHQGGHSNVNVGGRRVGQSAMTPPGAVTRITPGVLVGYQVFGPYEWMLRHISSWADDFWGNSDSGPWYTAGQVADTMFSKYIRELSRIKLNYMLPARLNPTPLDYHYPNWITSYPLARQAAADPSIRVYSTMFYLVEIASSVPDSDPRYLSPRTYRTNGKRPISIWSAGWTDPAGWSATKVRDYVWKDDWQYAACNDPEIGIDLETDASGNPIYKPVYMSSWYVFGGIDVGGERRVANPANWLDATDLERIPAPYLLDATDGDYDPSDLSPDSPYRREKFTYLGIAARPTTASLWPARFKGLNPSMLALSQVKVFNNTSWDLWTQDWQAQLMPVSQCDKWEQQLSKDIQQVLAQPTILNNEPSDAWQEARQLIKQLQPLMRDYMQH